MNYRANVVVGRTKMRGFPREDYDDALLDAVRLLLGYGGLDELKPGIKAVIEADRPKGDWYAYSEVNVPELVGLANRLAQGHEVVDPDPLYTKVIQLIHGWIFRGSLFGKKKL